MDIDQLLRDAPPIHGDMTHGLIPPALKLVASVRRGQRTLETGAGHSTIAFALAGAKHTCIVPNESEIAAIKAYCAEHGISLATVTFHAEASERVLPTLELDRLDFVLIDGSHSFPQVFIDWFYVAEPLKVGGTLLVDDTHIWTGRVLRDFLEAEQGWRLETELQGRTAIIVKVDDAGLDRVWYDQPYVAKRTGFGKPLSKARQAVSMARHGQTGLLVEELRSRLSRAR
jgi:predicted O-methyltransferase YrrM